MARAKNSMRDSASNTTTTRRKRRALEGSPDLEPHPKKQHIAGANNSHASANLDCLQNDSMRSLLGVVDELRHAGLNSVLSLPQLVVCGDQSSGKSSVLEAITQIPFPRSAMLCTRFATQIILRREAKQSITAKIIPDAAHPEARIKKLEDFQMTIADFFKLPDLIEEATKLMESASPGGSSPRKAFFNDMLSITVSGPEMLPLALVDLPGLIHTETSRQTKHDVRFINTLVSKYIENPRSIILAVVSANHDYANQVILQKARNVDGNGARTLGIITKPDCLDEGSEEEQSWALLAQNKDIIFELGWHILRNRAQAETDSTFGKRDQTEKEFFKSRAVYRNMDQKTLGIGHLRQRLSRLLLAHLKREIPKLNEELNNELAETSKRLASLGEQRENIPDIREFLLKSSTKFIGILDNALSGHYNNDFFRDGADTASKPVSDEKLRATIKYHNSYFSKLMIAYGGKYRFSDIPPEVLDIIGKEKDTDFDEDLEYLKYAEDLQIAKTHSEAVVWVHGKMHSSRGEELPGSISATLLKELFWEQTVNWKILTTKYIDLIAYHVQIFLSSLIQHVMPIDVVERIWQMKISPSLTSQKRNALTELDRVINDNRRAPMTYNHYYTDTIQKLRHKRIVTRARRIGKSMSYVPTQHYATASNRVVDIDTFLKAFEQELVESDMEKFTAEEALDCLMALYKDKLKNFIAEVTEQIIERHLVAPLLDSPISPIALARLSEEEALRLAAEPSEVTAERAQLSTIKSSLEVGQEAFERALIQYD